MYDRDCSAEQSEQAAVRNSLSSSGESEDNRMNRKEGKEDGIYIEPF